jgi:hypothetical protein
MRLLVLAVLLLPTFAHGSEPPRRLMPELCEADERPAVTALAVPDPVRTSVRRAVEADHRAHRRSRSRTADWLLAITAAAAASAIAIAATR